MRLAKRVIWSHGGGSYRNDWKLWGNKVKRSRAFQRDAIESVIKHRAVKVIRGCGGKHPRNNDTVTRAEHE